MTAHWKYWCVCVQIQSEKQFNKGWILDCLDYLSWIISGSFTQFLINIPSSAQTLSDYISEIS